MCCIEPSINASLPGMPNGKPAGVPCINLNLNTFRCEIWEQQNYPEFCRGFQAQPEFCGASQEEAAAILRWVEMETRPST